MDPYHHNTTNSTLIKTFYKNQRLFITGASGFVGKVLLARLLLEAPCEKIYILLRATTAEAAHERLINNILSSAVFDILRKKYGDEWIVWVTSRVEAIAGDLLSPCLGISKEILEKLQSQVTAIIHVAASVHFNSPLLDNYKSNVEGTLRILSFAKKCIHLQVFVHTSTCYVNSDYPGNVKEDIHPLPYDCCDVLKSIKQVMDYSDQQDSSNKAAELEKQILGRFPNTYAFTKRLCETIIVREWELRNIRSKSSTFNENPLMSLIGSDMHELKFPLCILRPSIVGCSYMYPQGGWLDNLNATGGILLLSALGILQALPANPNLISDQVPVDAVADALIVSCAAVAVSDYINTKSGNSAVLNHPAAIATREAAQFVQSFNPLKPIAVPEWISNDTQNTHHRRNNNSGANQNANPKTWGDAQGVYIVHCCTSDLNPTKWADALSYGREYNMIYPYHNRIVRELKSPYFHKDFDTFKRHFTLEQKTPAMIAATITEHLLPASSTASRASSLLYSGLCKAEKAAEAFQPFCYEEWVFEQKNIVRLLDFLTPMERQTLFVDVRKIDWRRYYHLFFYGIARFLLKESSGAEPPKSPTIFIDILRKYILDAPLDCPPLSKRILPSCIQFIQSPPAQEWSPDPEFIKKETLANPKLKESMKNSIEYYKKSGKRHPRTKQRMTMDEIHRMVDLESQTLYSSLAGTIKPMCVYILAGIIHKSFIQLLDRIIVDDTQIKKLKSVFNQSQPVLLLPTHRSYLDFLIISCISYTYGLPLPFIAADEAFATITLAHKLLRNAGAFFVKRNLAQNSVSKEKMLKNQLFMQILKSYVCVVAQRYGCIEIFLEGGRSKTGLLLKPKLGMLSWLTDLVYDGNVSDIIAIPVTFSYDRILESNTFPQELLGEEKTSEGLQRVLNVVRHMVNHSNTPQLAPTEGSRGLAPRCSPGYRPFGTVVVRFLDPISFKGHLVEESVHEPQLRTIVQSFKSADNNQLYNTAKVAGQPALVNDLFTESVAPVTPEKPLSTLDAPLRFALTASFANKIMSQWSQHLYITPTTLVATVLLMHHNGIREEDLIDQVAWLRDRVIERGGEISPGCGGFMFDPSVCVQVVLKRYLDDVVDQKRGGWEVSIYSGKSQSGRTANQSSTGAPWHAIAPMRAYVPRLLLAFYRNMAFHLFANEAFVVVSLQSFGKHMAWEGGVEFEKLEKNILFLLNLMSDQFVYHDKVHSDGIMNVVQLMISRGILQARDSNENNTLSKGAKVLFAPSSELIVSLLSCFLWPFVDSYWAFGNSLFALQPSSNDMGRAQNATQKQLVSRAHWLAHGLHKENVITFFESSAYPTMGSAVTGFKNIGVLKISNTPNDIQSATFQLADPYSSEEALQELLNKIATYRHSFANVLKHPDPNSSSAFNRRQMLSYLPIFARL